MRRRLRSPAIERPQGPKLHVPLRGVLLVGGAVLVITTLAFFRVPLLPAIGADLQMTAGGLGLLTTFFAVGRLVTDIPAGRLADRARAGPLLAASAAVVAAGSLLLAGSLGSAMAYGAAFVLGVGSAMTNTIGMTYFSTVAPADHRGTALSGFSAALLGGQAFGPTLGGVLTGLGTWRTTEVVAGVLGGGTALGMLRMSNGSTPARERPASPRRHRGAGPPFAPWPVRWVLYLVPFAVFGTLGAMAQTLVPIIGDSELGLTTAVIGLALGLGGVARLVGVVVGGQLADRVSRKAALVPGLLVQALGVALLAFGSSVAVWVASIVVMSLASYGIAVSTAMIADLARGVGVGRSLGTYRFVGDVGLIAAPAITAQLFEHVGKVPAVLPMAALLAVVGVAAAFVLPETRWLEGDRG